MRGFKAIRKPSTQSQPQSQSQPQPQYEIADILNRLGDKLEDLGFNAWQLRTLFALKKCRTSALGGHIDACDECGNISISYNSCRNRHCPKCQGKHLKTTKNRQKLLPKKREPPVLFQISFKNFTTTP